MTISTSLGPHGGESAASLANLTTLGDTYTLVHISLNEISERRYGDLATARQHIAELNSDKFDVRDKAFKALQSLSHTATPALRQALENNPPLEVRRRVESLLAGMPNLAKSPLILRQVRAIDVLEHLASKEATRLLTEGTTSR